MFVEIDFIMKTKKLIVYIMAAYLPMVAVGAVQFYLRKGIDPGVLSAKALAASGLSALAMLIPLAAVAVTRLIAKEPMFRNLGISFKVNRWWFAGWLLIPILALAIMGASALMPGESWSPDNETVAAAMKQIPGNMGTWGFIGITLISGLLAGMTINAVFAFGEEIGWRGYLVKLFEGQSFIRTSIITGGIWGLWHAPIILNGHNYPQHPVAGVFMMVLMCILFTPILLYFRQKSGSVIVAAIMHGTFNGVVGLSNIFVLPFNDLLVGAPGLAGMLVLLGSDAAIFLYDRYVTKERIFTSPI